ncbi:MAG: class I SAM-dependent methyltransferase [Absicoccus porci]|jgi:tRNA (adenine22-N1)-methyltransferase|uniref:SAM-dependent methyltransferase n=3 Tax=Absicoccus porci TaxID=2486576 RepID=A0A3N0I499_9FIRM|nr:class I SAM-dependent methyltransferase [Absicoccus porci]MCI6087870.1 class I SAM-dependent methyltransferase [Absicoccus porci]MDD6460660.1 class I SAM-dependent methyltransferase [Absicoccus porci]MDD7329690.1 class I SAM-dependent methyltransferase [Absicoccus porci]MDY4738375.1 class I SAM-dependent methyltransferase [Absicoccus porci]MEE1354390.1 class I SAM-dependent methyltransferase [Absicoccus porci]
MISKRLEHVVDWVEGNVLADIGCDHGYVCIESIKQHKVTKAYACDIAPKPLARAQAEVKSAHLEEQIQCLLLDGMVGLPEDVDIVVIAGMGGHTIIDILEKATLHRGMHFLISPHSDTELVRKFLISHGFTIEKEKMVYDKHYYPILACTYTQSEQVLSDFQIRYGYQVESSQDYVSYLQKQEMKYQQLFLRVPKKRKEFEKELEILQKRDTL